MSERNEWSIALEATKRVLNKMAFPVNTVGGIRDFIEGLPDDEQRIILSLIAEGDR